ncbi:glycoside hydrolase superfamily [Gongronella butleri]|nr:glycoside hydrolase superfamily [Gongronella butleri]
MEKEIQACQKKGKTVLLSMGGASGSYGLATPKDGALWATKMWNTFGNGKSKTRPFGKATVDGFDLDIEAGSPDGYAAFVNTMRKYYQKDASRRYYISGAPQCPFPDASLGKALDNAWFDYVWIQFYNNYCNLKGGQFNYDVWEKWAKTKSKNKKVQLFIGVPSSASAAGSGYAPIKTLKKTVAKMKKSPSFGGFMHWDLSQAYRNKVAHGQTFAKALHQLVQK